MIKRNIGLDIGVNRTLMVVLEYSKDDLVAVRYLESQQDSLAAQLDELRHELDADLRTGEKVAVVLSAGKAFVRDLEFPFEGSRKIAAALPMAMNLQIPIPVDSCTTASFLMGQKSENSLVKVKAASVSRADLGELLASGDHAHIPFHLVDLAPFAFIVGLESYLNDGLLILAGDQETTLSLVRDGMLVDYRLIPNMARLTQEDQVNVIGRELIALQRHPDAIADLSVYYAGDDGLCQLAPRLLARGFRMQELSLELADEKLPSKFVPAAALALRAAAPSKARSFNFRQGEFSLTGEWQKYRKSLLFSLALLVSVFLLLFATAVVSLTAKNDQVDVLQDRITEVYLETFPAATVIVDAPKQMEAALRELQQQSALLGGAQASVLSVLKTVSDLPADLNVEFQELSYSASEARITGTAPSFEQVNQLSEHLAQSTLFSEVRVSDAKMSLDGKDVSFRLLLVFSAAGGTL